MADSGNVFPEPACVVHATTSTGKKRTKRSSKTVRKRKSTTRRVILNKFSQERVRKSLKIDIIEVDDVEYDFADAFAFFTWYHENYARLTEVPKPLALKFRNQYLALNVNPEEDEWLKEMVGHKFLFDDCYYEKMVNSDSDESIYETVHKTDHCIVADDGSYQLPRTGSPTYRADSPEMAYCDTTDYSGSSDDVSSHIAEEMDLQNVGSDRLNRATTPSDVENPVLMDCDLPPENGTVLYKDLGARRLCGMMTDDDFREINERKKEFMKRKSNSNVKVRYGTVTLYLKLDNIRCYHRSDQEPLLVVDNHLWTVRQEMFLLSPQIVVRPRDIDIVRVVAMG